MWCKLKKGAIYEVIEKNRADKFGWRDSYLKFTIWPTINNLKKSILV
jgi:hypothetical protein